MPAPPASILAQQLMGGLDPSRVDRMNPKIQDQVRRALAGNAGYGGTYFDPATLDYSDASVIDAARSGRQKYEDEKDPWKGFVNFLPYAALAVAAPYAIPAISGLGAGSAGLTGATGAASAAEAAASMGAGAGIAGGGISGLAGTASGVGGLSGLLSKAGSIGKLLGAVGSLGGVSKGYQDPGPPNLGEAGGNYQNFAPAPQRQVVGYGGDYETYGEGPEHAFFQTPQMSMPPGPEMIPVTQQDYATGYSDGARVEGPGTGRSDDIPARLSDGEYVIDAETVALLGDGSSKAGADKLDEMRAKIRRHKGQKLSKGRISPNSYADAMQYIDGAYQ